MVDPWLIGIFAVGFLLGVIFRSLWAFLFPGAIAALILLTPWDQRGHEAPRSDWAALLLPPAAAGVVCGILVGRFVARRFAKPS